MLELLDPQKLDPLAESNGLLDQIRSFSLLPDKRIGWHYCLDYTWVATEFEKCYQPGSRVIDIGAGPGAVHGYLEDAFGTEILGIDMQRWDKDYVDIVGNFCDEQMRQQNEITNNSVDIIISTSAFEHNSPKHHQKLVSECKKVLKTGGHLITTFAASRFWTSYFRRSHQWNMSRRMIELTYADQFESYDFKGVCQRWRDHCEIPDNYIERHGKIPRFFPPFLAAGAHITNGGSILR